MKASYLALSAAVFLSGAAYGADLDDGWAAFNRGEFEKAYDVFSEVFREDPSNIEANLALGAAAYQKKKFSHAVFAFERVLMAEPGHEKAMLGNAQALQALGQSEEALSAYTAVKDNTADDAIRSEAIAGLKSIQPSFPRFSGGAVISISGVYDDNVNYGADDNLIPASKSKETAGVEGSIDAYAAYDVGDRNGWLLIGGASVYDSWYDEAPEQELRNLRGYAGARLAGQKSMFEVVGRSERLWYGGSTLVDLLAGDLAYLLKVSSTDWLTTSLTVEKRDYDEEFDPDGKRDSIYTVFGESWKHRFNKRNNYIGLGGDLFYEDASSGSGTYFGYRIRLDGQVELPGAVLTYAGGRYRGAKYDAPDSGTTTEREDDRWDFFVGAKKRLTERLLIDLQYLYIRNDSNVALYDYDRNRINLTATYEF